MHLPFAALSLTALTSFPFLSAALEVRHVTSKDFESVIKENEVVLASFSDPSLASTKAFAPELDEAADAMTSLIVAIDCTKDKSLCDTYDINAYPSLRIFRGLNSSTPYRGLRKASSMISTVTKARLPVLSKVTVENVSTFKEVDDTVVIAYVDADDDFLPEVMAEVADEMHNEIVFGISTDPEAAKKENITSPTVACYKNLDYDHLKIKGQFNEDTLKEFLKISRPLVIGEITKRNVHDYMSDAKPLLYIFYTDEKSALHLRRELTPLAKKYSAYINTGLINSNEYAHMATNLDLRPNIFPAITLHHVMKDEVFPFDQRKEITAESATKWLEDVTMGKVSPGPVPMNVDDDGEEGAEKGGEALKKESLKAKEEVADEEEGKTLEEVEKSDAEEQDEEKHDEL